MRKKDKGIAREMLIAGQSVDDVAKQTGVPPSTVLKIDEWLHRANSRIWFETYHPEAIQRYHPSYAPKPPVEEEEPAPAAPITATINSAPLPPPAMTTAPQPVAPMGYSMPNGTITEQPYYPPAHPQVVAPTQPPQAPQPRMMMVRENEDNGTMQVLAQPRPIDIGSEPAAGKGRGNVNVTPMTLVWYDYMRSTGYDRDLPSFLEETTVGYFAKSGRKFVMVVDSGLG